LSSVHHCHARTGKPVKLKGRQGNRALHTSPKEVTAADWCRHNSTHKTGNT